MASRVCTLLLTLVLLSPGALAAAPAKLHAVQVPVWIERGERYLPAHPGAALRAGDLLRTGAGGRAQVDLADGSRVKLGEGARFRPDRLAENSDQKGGLFSAALSVLKGAFRFTTGLAGRERRRNVDLDVGAMTIGVRGTDLWGRSAEDQDFVVLLEGRITVAMAGVEPAVLTEPLDGRVSQSGEPMQPMAGVTMAVVQELAKETELAPEDPALVAGGAYAVVVGSFRRQEDAQGLQRLLLEGGFPALVRTFSVAGKEWHRVAFTGLPDAAAARDLGQRLLLQPGVGEFWIGRF